MKRVVCVLLAVMMVLTCVCASAQNSQTQYAMQVVKQGGSNPAGWYNEETMTYTDANLKLNADGVAISKTISPTGYENHFDITLKVATEYSYEEIIKSPSTDVVIVMDKSRTMQSNNLAGTSTTRLAAAKTAANAFIDAYNSTFTIDSNHRLAFVTFDSNAKTEFGLNSNLTVAQMKSAVSAIQTRSSTDPDRFTNIEGGLQLARNLLKNSKADHKYVVFLSDGMPTTYIESNRNDANDIYGYDVYQSGNYTGSTADGYFADRMNQKTCSAGVDYSDKGAEKAQTVAAALKGDGVNVFSIGIDIGTQTVWNYVARHLIPENKYFSTVDRYADRTHYVIGEPVVKSPTTLNPSASYAGYYINWLTNKISGGPDYQNGLYFDGSNTGNLASAFSNILTEIVEINEREIVDTWAASDPMGSLIEFDGFYTKAGKLNRNALTGENAVGAENTVSLKNNAIDWKIFNSGYRTVSVGGKDVYIYELTYRIRLKNENSAFPDKENKAIATNGVTQLKYKINDNGTLSKEKTMNFAIPEIKGYLGELSFRKTEDDANRTPIEGVLFTLRHDHDCPVCVGGLEQTIDPSQNNPSEHNNYNIVSIDDQAKRTDKNGYVTFTNIPSGHHYTLYEQVPNGYGAMTEDLEWSVVVAYDKTTITADEHVDGYAVDEKITDPEDLVIMNTPQHEMTHVQFKATKLLENVHAFDADKFIFDLTLSADTGSDAANISFGNEHVHEFTTPVHSATVTSQASDFSEGASAEVLFPLVHVKDVGTYLLTVRERVGNDERIEYTDQWYVVKFEVTRGSVHPDKDCFVLQISDVWLKTCTPQTESTAQFVKVEKNTRSDILDIHALVNLQLVFTNSHKLRDFTFNKKDLDTLAGIPGVEFVLEHAEDCGCGYDIDPRLTYSDASGRVYFADILSGHHYVMTETIPVGYENAGDELTFDVFIPVDEKLAPTINGTQQTQILNRPVYAPVSMRIGGLKSVLGVNGFANDEFAFTLTLTRKPDGAVVHHSAADNGVMTTLTVKNGNVDIENAPLFVFPDVFFSSVGEYEFTLTEANSSDPRITSDGTVYTIGVTVSQGALDEESGCYALVCTYTLKKDGIPVTFSDGTTVTDNAIVLNGGLTFENSHATTDFGLTKRDRDTNAVMPGVRFVLEHLGCDCNYTIATYEQTTDASGAVSFTGVPVGHTYSLRETVPTGYMGQGGERTYVVTIALDGTVSIDGDDSGIIINDPQYMPGSAMFGGLKSVPDADSFAAGLFSFSMKLTRKPDGVRVFVGNDNTELLIGVPVTAQNGSSSTENGRFYFPAVHFEAVGDYTFEITEMPQAGSDIIYDNSVYTIDVQVTQGELDEQEGRFGFDFDFALQKDGVAVEFPGGAQRTGDIHLINAEIVFDNDLNEGSFRISKVSSYDRRILPGAHFSLIHVHADVNGTPSVEGYEPCCDDYQFEQIDVVTDAYGVAEFTGVPQGHMYYLVETKAPDGYVAIEDPMVVQVTAQGVTIDGKPVGGSESLENRPEYWPVDVPIVARKTFDGRTPNLKYTFVLEDENGVELARVQNDGSNIRFATLTFETPGTYTYYLREIAGDEYDILYDLRVFEITIEVYEYKEEGASYGELRARITYSVDGEDYEEPVVTFENMTRPPETGDASKLSLWLTLMLGASVTAFALIVVRRAREN